MGYRIRLGEVKKREAKEFRNMTMEEIVSYYKNRTDAPYRPEYHTQLYEIGKYVDYPKFRTPYYKFDIYEIYTCEFDILSKDGLKYIIEEEHSEINDYFVNILQRFNKSKDATKLYNCIRAIQTNWDEKLIVKPYWLDEDRTDGAIVKSWRKDYAIFNLIHIYRFFDWKNNYLIHSAW